MDVKSIGIDKHKARDLYQKYRKHTHYETDMDREIKRAYKEIAAGKVVIQAIESIKRAGLDAKGRPKLALARATASHCWIERWKDGSLKMTDIERPTHNQKPLARYPAASFDFPAGSFPDGSWRSTRHRAAAPIIPIHLRPKRGIEAYHLLWEAEWEPMPPCDPYLLRRIGKADLWIVCAAWDLTDVEMAAMSTRVMAQ